MVLISQKLVLCLGKQMTNSCLSVPFDDVLLVQVKEIVVPRTLGVMPSVLKSLTCYLPATGSL